MSQKDFASAVFKDHVKIDANESINVRTSENTTLTPISCSLGEALLDAKMPMPMDVPRCFQADLSQCSPLSHTHSSIKAGEKVIRSAIPIDSVPYKLILLVFTVIAIHLKRGQVSHTLDNSGHSHRPWTHTNDNPWTMLQLKPPWSMTHNLCGMVFNTVLWQNKGNNTLQSWHLLEQDTNYNKFGIPTPSWFSPEDPSLWSCYIISCNSNFGPPDICSSYSDYLRHSGKLHDLDRFGNEFMNTRYSCNGHAPVWSLSMAKVVSLISKALAPWLHLSIAHLFPQPGCHYKRNHWPLKIETSNHVPFSGFNGTIFLFFNEIAESSINVVQKYSSANEKQVSFDSVKCCFIFLFAPKFPSLTLMYYHLKPFMLDQQFLSLILDLCEFYNQSFFLLMRYQISVRIFSSDKR